MGKLRLLGDPKIQFWEGAIFLDAFSPQHCPELWTEEFLKYIAEKLTKNGRIITYSSAAAIRGSLQRAGLNLYSIQPKIVTKRSWSSGTVATKSPINKEVLTEATNTRQLSSMEEAHLQTKASAPYRDPSGLSTKTEILKRRNKEQQLSKLNTTSSWKKQWIETNTNKKL